ncbi:unnamed protein product [Choristocarpus tenellus]
MYTKLKSSLEMAKHFTALLAEALIVDKEGEEPKGATMTLYFPDMGSAALAKHQWQSGNDTAQYQVPEGVRFASVTSDSPLETDVGCIVLCPRNSEAEGTLKLVEKISHGNTFMVLVNPELINMGTTGYGLAGRRVRDEILSIFQTCYYLRTLPWGAVTMEYGKKYSVWQDEPKNPTGYRLLKSVRQRPLGEVLDDIYLESNSDDEPGATPKFLDSVAGFVRDFGRL